ncbi:type II secretion system minor pseudopilin GspH [Citrobacter rodentium]|jgi:general secretion pathway protein H|uniref:Type II secretion system protein H n=2 Tax=Citrobacter rodentium TaxID=67825 RepID=D2TMH4_CITRI|nr:type II secretion system minor pseudopilin GspH [Citrobacter rodentium]KIQ52830.1 hypothetical protein TA05_02365 [Citrobacter rodentium]QBY30758.1 type II secretion system protein GspH [Citrobacter rodentium]UHO31875.1 type II secretion system minor pseudopilin GspH [Citrobacter rodentium NBRC 105723 = DSM 16636]CBG91188.1 putative T2SS protein H [Citrobacter rodentium ICC168]HAT8014560.1 hypothetical protein [Citrobacter rodentium NBRC 105723 = DSM 16636]
MKQQQGFTLLEVLLTIVIVAMMTAGVIISQSERLSPEGRLLQNVDAFRLRIEYAADWALLEKTPIGIRLDRDGWSFWQLKKNAANKRKWTEVTRHETLRLRGDWQSPRPPSVTPAPVAGGPQIVITPDGEITPFTLNFRDESNARLLGVQNTGNLPLLITRSGKQR